ncbi:MAG TPA: LuxR C-terminal-related transcriptional regulator [Chloroflexota bacterium]|jgi:DNA-binding NarL/FixJ family response regulator|nr:LuxR C-terminal-related transcriptional regulator [Chloroflexota bacterium]
MMSDHDVLVVTSRPLVSHCFGLLAERFQELFAAHDHSSFVVHHIDATVQAVRAHKAIVDKAVVAVVDVCPNPSGAVAICQIFQTEQPKLQLLGFLCCPQDVRSDLIQALVKSGMTSFIGSHATPEEMITSLQRVGLGETVVNLHVRDVAGTIIGIFFDGLSGATDTSSAASSATSLAAVPRLRDEDRHLLSLMADGLTDQDIGQHLHLSVATVQRRLERLCAAVGARNRTHLAAWAARHDFYHYRPATAESGLK